MLALWTRAVLYLLVVAGGWLFALPAIILRTEVEGNLEWRTAKLVVTGTVLFAAGCIVAAWAGFCLVQYGRGTPLPLDPPRRLVVTGPYGVVRNPQAIGMLLMVVGEVVAVSSRALWLLVPATIIYLEWIVGPWERRQMQRDFGTEYLAYRATTPRWWPRLRRRSPESSSRARNSATSSTAATRQTPES
jgi:protein-S-isoprenylcysteine O-methyltransferase Ste14